MMDESLPAAYQPATNVNNALRKVVEAGADGGGFTIFGRLFLFSSDPNAEAEYIFWMESDSMNLDENDDETWVHTRSDLKTEVTDLLPSNYFRLYPVEVGAEFGPLFRALLEAYKFENPNDLSIGNRKRMLDYWEEVIAKAERLDTEWNTQISEQTPRSAYPPGELAEEEYAALVAACVALPPAQGDYRITDFVENLLLTVVDFMLNTPVVVKAMEYFKAHTKADALDLKALKIILAQYPDDEPGNKALAQRLWGYNLWTRAEMLRRLVTFFETNDVTDQERLELWAAQAQFKANFEGKVKGLGYAVFNWLVIRQGIDSIKPDVHVLRFVERAIGRPIKPETAVEMLLRAATDLKLPAHKLDWAIWENGRGGAAQ